MGDRPQGRFFTFAQREISDNQRLAFCRMLFAGERRPFWVPQDGWLECMAAVMAYEIQSEAAV